MTLLAHAKLLIMAITVGETAAAILALNFLMGLSKTWLVIGGLLVVALFLQFEETT